MTKIVNARISIEFIDPLTGAVTRTAGEMLRDVGLYTPHQIKQVGKRVATTLDWHVHPEKERAAKEAWEARKEVWEARNK